MLDLGSGGGIDVFLAASKVRPTGQAIGLDGSAVRCLNLVFAMHGWDSSWRCGRKW